MLPTWFVEDEQKHCFKIPPITKDEYLQEKERLRAITTRTPKKVMEAKIRKQKRLTKKLQKVKVKAKVVMEQEGLNENAKMKQV